MAIGRSREGAWIEIDAEERLAFWQNGRSREGAWIEMYGSAHNIHHLWSLP